MRKGYVRHIELTVDSDQGCWRGSLPCAVRCHAAVVGCVHQPDHDEGDDDGGHGLHNDDEEEEEMSLSQPGL